MSVKKLLRSDRFRYTNDVKRVVNKALTVASDRDPSWFLVSQPIEPIIKLPVIFGMLGIYQGMFSANALEIPERLKRTFSNRVFRVFSLFMIALQSTGGDIENALLAVICFSLLLYTIKTKEERKKSGFL